MSKPDDAVVFSASLVYSALLAVGGVVGYVQAASKGSIIAGTISASLVCGLALSTRALPQYRGALRKVQLIVIGSLVLFFMKRYLQTSKFMPGGLMAILGVVVIAIIIVAAPSSTGEAKRNDKKKK